MLVCYCSCEHCQKIWVLHCRYCKVTLWNLTWMWIFLCAISFVFHYEIHLFKKVFRVLHGGCFLTSTAETGFHQKLKEREAEILAKLLTFQKNKQHRIASHSCLVFGGLDVSSAAGGCWQPAGFPGPRCWSRSSSGWKQEGRATGRAWLPGQWVAEQSKQRYWHQGQGDDVYILNPS